MNPRHYVDLKETSRDLQPTYYFMINCLLYSRMETGLVSNQDFYDEDVNVYLAHLLHSFINPEYVEQSKKFLSKYDTDVFRRLSNSTDARLKYSDLQDQRRFPAGLDRDLRQPDDPGGERSGISRAKRRTSAAARPTTTSPTRTASRCTGRTPGVSEVLEKLSVGFEKYIRILSHMRGEYLDLVQRLSSGEVYHLERSIDEHSQQELLRVKQDELLELYSAWKSEPSKGDRGEPRAGGQRDPAAQSIVQVRTPEAIVQSRGSGPSARFAGAHSLSADLVVRRFLGDRHVVRVALASPALLIAHEAASGCAAPRCRGRRSSPFPARRPADHLEHRGRQRTLERHAALDALGHELRELVRALLEVALAAALAGGSSPRASPCRGRPCTSGLRAARPRPGSPRCRRTGCRSSPSARRRRSP